MTKMELINILSSINFVCENEEENLDRQAFEPLIKTKPEMGVKCLYAWTSKYYVSLRSRKLIENYAKNPTWDNFHLAAHFLMLDRVVAAIALDGNVVSKVEDCIKATLKCGDNIDVETLTWVKLYTSSFSQQHLVA